MHGIKTKINRLKLTKWSLLGLEHSKIEFELTKNNFNCS